MTSETPRFKVVEYQGGHDADVADLILSIQNGEGGLSLTTQDQPDLLDIVRAYRDGGFWVAYEQDSGQAQTASKQEEDVTSSNGSASTSRVVGTLGMACYRSKDDDVPPIGVLKKFFIRKDFRGSQGPSAQLYECLHKRAIELDVTAIVLDTPSFAKRAHAFYERMGFKTVSIDQLPHGYSYPVPDSTFYRLDLEQKPKVAAVVP